MDDDIRLGYQAGVVSPGSPTYGRLWLSIAHNPDDTVSCTQAEALVLAAEGASCAVASTAHRSVTSAHSSLRSADGTNDPTPGDPTTGGGTNPESGWRKASSNTKLVSSNLLK